MRLWDDTAVGFRLWVESGMFPDRMTLDRTYLLTTVLSSGADFVFIPERPPKADPWEDEMCAIIHKVCIVRRKPFALLTPLNL